MAQQLSHDEREAALAYLNNLGYQFATGHTVQELINTSIDAAQYPDEARSLAESLIGYLKYRGEQGKQ